MSKYKEEIKQVHDNTDFKLNFAGITLLGEFVYSHGGTVQPGLDYHIHYTNNKQEVYMIGGVDSESSRIVQKVGGTKTLFTQYTDVKVSTKEEYPVITPAYPSESDYSIGSITRYFTQKANNPNGAIFEISEEDFENQNSLFKYIDFEWRLSGTKQEVTRFNQITINAVNVDLPGISRHLFPLQYWRPPKNSPDDLQKKLLLLKKP